MVALDTSFVIDLFNGQETAKKVMEKYDSLGEELNIPSPVVMELISGANLHAKRENEREDTIKFLSGLVVIDFNRESAILAGDIEAELTKKGEIIDIEDVMIGAIVKKNNEVLVTKNVKHFEKIEGLRIEGY